MFSLIIFSSTLFYASLSGAGARDRRISAMGKHQSEVVGARQKYVADIQALEKEGAESSVPSWAGSPMDLTFSSILPPAALGDFSIGQADILPYMGVISLWNPDIRMFSKYEFEDPVALALGAFDLSKAILLLMPLLLIVLCFDVLSGERDGKRLGLMLAQGLRLRRFFWHVLIMRAAVVLGVTVLIAFLALVFFSGEETIGARLPAFGLWLLGVVSYGIFWIALIGLIASRNRSGEGHMLVLLLTWAGFTLILPACSVALAEYVYPTPSRLAYLAEAREVENQTTLEEADLANQFFLDHPEISVAENSDFPEYFQTSFLVTTSVDEATRPILQKFMAASADRERALAWLNYASPAMAVQQYFTDIAGTSGRRHHSYMAQARTFKSAYAARVKPTVMAGKRMSLNTLPKLDNFQFRDESLSLLAGRFGSLLIYYFLLLAGLLWRTDHQLRQIKGP